MIIRSNRDHSQARILFFAVIGALITTYLASNRERFSHSFEITRLSNELLLSSQSPFARAFNPNTENEIASEPRQTDALLQTLNAPFGLFGSVDTGSGVFTHRVASGETLAAIWLKYSKDRDSLNSAIKTLNALDNHARSLRPGEEIKITTDSGEIVSLQREYDDGSLFSLLRDDQTEEYRPELIPANIVEKDRAVTGYISKSFSASADNLAIPYDVVDDFVDLFSNRIEFNKDFQPGDTFSVTYAERVTDSGKVVNAGYISSASVMLGDKFYAAVASRGKDGNIVYYDENGRIPGNSFLRYPLQFTRISSVFSTARFHPVLNISRPHNGVDFAAPNGTPVRSVGDGQVIYAGYSKSTGNMVRIQHDSRYTTEYMHLSSIAKGVTKGSKVSRGCLIGAVGSTGLATGPHLHFGLFDKGQYIDPLKTKILSDTGKDEAAPKLVMAALEELKRSHAQMLIAKQLAKSLKQAA